MCVRASPPAFSFVTPNTWERKCRRENFPLITFSSNSSSSSNSGSSTLMFVLPGSPTRNWFERTRKAHPMCQSKLPLHAPFLPPCLVLQRQGGGRVGIDVMFSFLLPSFPPGAGECAILFPSQSAFFFPLAPSFPLSLLPSLPPSLPPSLATSRPIFPWIITPFPSSPLPYAFSDFRLSHGRYSF